MCHTLQTECEQQVSLSIVVRRAGWNHIDTSYVTMYKEIALLKNHRMYKHIT